MLLSIAGLSACDNLDLAAYKTTAKSEITNHVQGLTSSNYTPANWTLIEQRADEGKAAVEAAASKPAVDTAKMEAITDIDNVPKEESAGAFFSLQEAFDKGLLTKADLESIAYYHNDDSMPVYPETLDADIVKASIEDIKNNANGNKEDEMELTEELKAIILQDLCAKNSVPFKSDLINTFILAYYGTYNGCVVLSISYITYSPTITIGGVKFFINIYQITTWYKGNFYSLQEAYDSGYLIQENLKQIKVYYENGGIQK